MTREKGRLWLGIDTTRQGLSVAIVIDDGSLESITDNSAEPHSRRLLPLIGELLKDKKDLVKIVEVAVNTGPGSFTGLRVGIACASGLSRALGISARGVDAFDVHAAACEFQNDLVAIVLSSARGEVSAGLRAAGADGSLDRVGEDMSGPPDTVVSELRKRIGSRAVCGAGDAAELLLAAGIPFYASLKPPRPLAEAVALRSRFLSSRGVPAGALAANYLRPADAEIHRPVNGK
jgi:tRNA threonylcarbamoyladenosine biosynthesis protein TsaB